MSAKNKFTCKQGVLLMLSCILGGILFDCIPLVQPVKDNEIPAFIIINLMMVVLPISVLWWEFRKPKELRFQGKIWQEQTAGKHSVQADADSTKAEPSNNNDSNGCFLIITSVFGLLKAAWWILILYCVIKLIKWLWYL